MRGKVLVGKVVLQLPDMVFSLRLFY